MPQYTSLQVKQPFLELFCVSAQVLQTQISRTENGPHSTSSMRARPKKVNRDFGSLTKKQEKKDLQVCIQKPNSGFLAL